MSLLQHIDSTIKEHPSMSGIISSIGTTSFSIIGILSQEGTVRLIGSIGGIIGIALTLLSIYYKIKKR